MLRILILTLIISLNLSSAFAGDTLASTLQSFNTQIKKSGSVDYSENCGQCQQSASETSTLYSALNKKNIELSVLSEERALEVFNKLKNDEDIPFNYPLDGCYARAHKMALDMDDMGIVSGKAFVEGDLYVDTKLGEAGWSYHVASIVFVKKDGKLVPTVFDPALFDHPVSYDEWKALLLKKPQAHLQSEYFTKRFNYDPDSRYNDMKDYDEDEVSNMKETNRMNGRTAEMLEMTQKLQAKGKT